MKKTIMEDRTRIILLAVFLLFFLGQWLPYFPNGNGENISLARYLAFPTNHTGVTEAIEAQLADYNINGILVSSIFLPLIGIALLVLMILYAKLQWFPPGRMSIWASLATSAPDWTWYTNFLTIDSLLNGRFDIFLDALRHLILPIITLSYLNWALYLRVTRSSMLETLRQDYITTARAKGIVERQVVNRHALPNALIPVVTLGGLTVAGLLGGVVITETIFDYPGIGSAAARAASNLDVITVLVFTLLTGAILIVANLIVDVAYAFLDPRVRLS